MVCHDEGGNERTQLSLLHLDGTVPLPAGPADLVPLVRDPAYVHNLGSVTAERLCYWTNRRNNVDFDVVVRDLATGTEEVGYDGGGHASGAAVSPDGRWLALTIPGRPALSDQILLVDLTAPPGPARVRALTSTDDPDRNETLHWTPDSTGLIVTSNHHRDFSGLARYSVPTDAWDWLVRDDEHDLMGWLAPDGTTLLVECNDHGTSLLACTMRVPAGSSGTCRCPRPVA